VLNVEDIVKSYGATQALRGVSLSIAAGEIHGLCGVNGAGKSTLVKVLAGLESPDSGAIKLEGKPVRFDRPRDAQAAGIAVIDQELSVIGELTVAENIRLGSIKQPFLQRPRASQASIRKLLDRVGLHNVPPSILASRLSMAQRQLVEVARLLDRDARLLILDEPTASLSQKDSVLIFSALRELSQQGTCALYVSHRLGEVIDLCSVITVLRDGRVVADQDVEHLDHAKLVNLILGEGLNETKQAASTAAAGTRQQHTASAGGQQHSGVDIRNVSVPGKVSNFSLQIKPGQVVALAGQVGSGASEVLRALGGLEPFADVEVFVEDRRVNLKRPPNALAAGFFFVSNNRRAEGLFLSRRVADNLMATRLGTICTGGFLSKRTIQRAAGTLAPRILIPAPLLRAPAITLSGGNQQRVFIGRSLERPGTRLLILDEPTRGVDVRGRATIHDLIRQASDEGAAVLFASGELDEILDLADVVVSLQHGAIVSVNDRSALTEDSLLAEITRTHSESMAGVDAD
jgi:ABC-type sugar transport system ATPase subunit